MSKIVGKEAGDRGRGRGLKYCCVDAGGATLQANTVTRRKAEAAKPHRYNWCFLAYLQEDRQGSVQVWWKRGSS